MLTSGEWEWTEPEDLGPVVNSAAVDGNVAISHDGLTLYFDSYREGGRGRNDLWTCRRVSLDEPWQAPTNIGPPVNTQVSDDRPTISKDEMTLIFVRNGDIWQTTRIAKDKPWSAPKAITKVNTVDEDLDPFLTQDGRRLLLASQMQGNGFRIYQSERTGSGKGWETPTPFGVPATDDQRAFHGSPWISADGTVFMFTSDRDGGYGNLDVWLTTRRAASDAWSNPINLGPRINSEHLERSPRYCLLQRVDYFMSDRPGGQGRRDIWMSRLVRKNRASLSRD